MDLSITPQDLITEEVVVESITKDYGPNAKLLSWYLQDNIKHNDKFSSYVTSIKANISVDGEEAEHSYIAKLNPCRQSECWKCVTNSIFIREEYFLHDISPRLCNILRSYNQHPLRLPIDLYTSCDVGKEMLISKDLRENNFVMVDRRKGLDAEHTKLVLQELARLHAASFLLEEQNIGEELQDIYPFLQDEWGDDHHVYYQMFDNYTQNQLKHTIQLLQEAGGYNKAISWIESISSKIQSILKEQLLNPEERFKVICHGDLQINNILFRYSNGSPAEVMLLDLQRARVSSIAADLNYFLYTSLDGKSRRDYLNDFLQEYYKSYSSVLTAAHIPMKFTLEDLHDEFHNKNILGFIYGINAGITLLMETEDFATYNGDNTIHKVADVKLSSIIQNPLFNSRVQSLVDEMTDNQIIQ